MSCTQCRADHAFDEYNGAWMCLQCIENEMLEEEMEKHLNKIYNIDCLEFMKTLPDKCIDLVLTDPPYGINADKGSAGTFGSSSKTVRKYEGNWDSQTPPMEVFKEILRIGKKAIIFGGNFFTDKLPVGSHWIVWDKVGGVQFDNPFSKCELAWTNLDKKSIQKYICIQQGFVAEERDRFHPTQKPVSLFEGIIRDYSEEGIIFDPFLGSGTTALDCKHLKRNYIGCEISKEYCDIAQKRLDTSTNLLF